ncbi:hypothetical protein HG535_0C04200 [Zygotorulaspora mrakii]|uniref:Decapping nuclease n=1 Tax=Zygotorulaspora mrakii TaxID=42260 RepID=A0A7H9B0X4_ZYGMR|nr:uncharacterized protein HG535_0C04200 [Zygotorulaspora mrakii]QLG72066.1 hypothetical protein HG535_0C04200 [Zygotorulaspora mrakii]
MQLKTNTNGSQGVKEKKNKSRPKTKKKQAVACIPGECFTVPKICYSVKRPWHFYTECREVATYHNGCLLLGTHFDLPTIPRLSRDISQLCDLNSIEYKRKFLGANLYSDYENHNPPTLQELDDATPCFQYYNKLRSTSSFSLSHLSDEVQTILSPRHHIVEMVMSLFDGDEFSMICTTFGSGKILFSLDNTRKKMLPAGSDNRMKKMAYTGIALERALTHNDTRPYFSIVEGFIKEKDVNLILRCEMDAINELKNMYTELKCYSKLNLHNIHHRRKMLKTWVQISLIPQSDLIIGLRDQGGILRDLLWYSREKLYADLTNPSLPRNKRYKDFNPNVAVAWFHHCIHAITQNLLHCTNDITPSQSFKVVFYTNHAIKINQLNSVPRYAKTIIQKYSTSSI